MRYLRKFNENINLTKDDFTEQCEVYISEMEDLGMSVGISTFDTLVVIFITNDNASFSWDYIKDILVPFLEFINTKYNLHSIMVNDEYWDDEDGDAYKISVEEITSDEYNPSEVSYLEIRIRE